MIKSFAFYATSVAVVPSIMWGVSSWALLSCTGSTAPAGAVDVSVTQNSDDVVFKKPPLLDPDQAKVILISFEADAAIDGGHVPDPSPPEESTPEESTEDPAELKEEDSSRGDDDSAENPAENYVPLSEPIKFPKIEVKFDGANMVQVLRCPQANRKFYTDPTLGDEVLDITELRDKLSDDAVYAQRRYQDFWLSALSLGKCEFVGHHVIRTRIFDFAALSGNYYYILNPCVSKEFSTTAKEGCSYNLLDTPTFQRQGGVSSEVRDLIFKLSQIEGQVVAKAELLQTTAYEIAAKHEACEIEAAVRAHNEAVDNAWKGIKGGIVGAVVGVVLAAFTGRVDVISRSIHYGMNKFREEITAEERYAKYSKCPEVLDLMSVAEGYFEDLDKMYIEAMDVRVLIAKKVDSLASFSNKIASEYTNADTLYTTLNPPSPPTSSSVGGGGGT